MASIIKISIFIISLVLISIIKCEEECPISHPIYNTLIKNCTMEYCTQSQFDEGICIISNSLTKKHWLNSVTVISISNNSNIYPNIAYDEDHNLLLETDINKTNKIFISFEKDGNSYNNEKIIFDIIKENGNYLYNYYPQSILTTVNQHRMYYSFSSYESLQIFDLDENIFTENILEKILGHNINSRYNSLLKTNEENIYIYSYITTGNRLIIQKIKLIQNGIEVIKTLIEDKKITPKNSRKCIIVFISGQEFIECLDIDEELNYIVRIYKSNDLTFFKEFILEKSILSKEELYDSFNEVVNINGGNCFFIYYNHMTNSGIKPVIYIKNFNGNTLSNYTKILHRKEFYSSPNYDYHLSNKENALTKIEYYYFIFVTLTTGENNHLMVALINILSNFALYINYVDIPLKDLYNINYFSNIYAFPFNGCFGVGYISEKDNQYINSIILFGYANTTDPEPINNIFYTYNKEQNNIFSIKLSDYALISNNIFCFYLKSIIIISYPLLDTGIEIIKQSSNEVINRIKREVSISANEIINISYTGELTDVKKGNYKIEFIPEFSEARRAADFLQCLNHRDAVEDEEIIRKYGNPGWAPDIFRGRKTTFKFTVANCYKNCYICSEESSDELNQKCSECLPGYYFEENTNNCFNKERKGFYFDKNKNIFRKCNDNCNTCYNTSEGNIHYCSSCKEGYLLYNSSNCLKCKSMNLFVDYNQISCIGYIPSGYYLNNSEYNTLDKCHQNCYSCSEGPNATSMNCKFCDSVKNLFLIENTSNCELPTYEGYYLSEENILKKCHPFCKTCSKGPIQDNMNCDSCNNNLGYFMESTENNNKNCVFKAKENMYYISENDTYGYCYKNCLYCFDKEKNVIEQDTANNYIIMNCLKCDEANNFFLFTKNGNNCLNCKAQNKYVNFAQTECIDNIPDGYFLLNNSTNEIDQCYHECKTCSEKGISSDDMKCDSCYKSEGYFLWNGNCVLKMTCPEFFYYKINNNENNNNETFLFEEKQCLNSKEECPKSLPYYYTKIKECINECPLDLILNEDGCKIANIDIGFEQFISMLYNKYTEGGLKNFEENFSFIYNESQNFIFKIKFGELEMNNTNEKIIFENEIKRIDDNGYITLDKKLGFIDDEINLEECLELLDINNISNKDTKLSMRKLYIMNINNKNAINSSYIFKFQLIDENNKQKLNLSICPSINKTFIVNLNNLIEQKREELNSKITDEKIIEIESDNNKEQINDDENNDIYNSHKYNNDKCAVIYNEFGADILLEDRISLYYERYVNDFNYEDDVTEKTEIINPAPNPPTIPRILYYPNISIPLEEICPLKYHLIHFDYNTKDATCFYSINISDISNDINIYDIIKNSEGNNKYTYMGKDYLEIQGEPIDNKKINIIRNLESISERKVSTEIKSDLNIKYMKCIGNISKQFKNNYILIILTILDIIYITLGIIYFILFRKKYVAKANNNDINFQIKKIMGLKGSLSSSFKLKQNPPPKLREIKNNKNFKKTIFSSINSDLQSINNNNINNKNKNNYYYYNNNKNQTNFEELTGRQNNNNNINYSIGKNIITKEEGKKDYDLSLYLTALERDKRNIWELFISISKKKQIYYFAFKEDQFCRIIKICILVFTLINYFVTNIFFYNDKVIHQIYIDKSNYNFTYQIGNVLLSALISCAFLYLAKYILLFKKSDKQILCSIKFVDYGLIIIFLLIIFYWLYAGSFTSVFIKSQKHISINFLLTIVVCIIYEIILTIISISLRKIAICHGDMPLLYKISQRLILLSG